MNETSEQDASPEVNEQELQVQRELKFYKMTNPEATIFRRKKNLARRLLELSIDDLKNAPDQSWYKEYHALPDGK